MYNLQCRIPANREPWNISLDERCKKVFSAVSQGKKVAAMLYHHADTSTFRYRCYNVAQITKKSEEWQCVYFFMDELHTLNGLLSQCNLLILSRLKWEHRIDAIIALARRNQIPVLFDVDDLVCDIRYMKLLTNTLNIHFGGEVDYDFWFANIARLECTAGLADGFITTNDFLGKKLSERFGKPYQIIPNSLNEEQLLISKECVIRKAKQKKRKPFTIGYFSGTPSHINDFKMIYQELMQLLVDYPDMVLQVVGFMDFPDTMQPLIQSGKVRFTPLVDFMELQRLMAQVDINIVPLVQNTFTNCKSELKFFEAAVVDTVTVATPIHTYKHAIDDGKSGFLCRPGQWYDRIAYLYSHPEESERMAKAAKEYCLKHYTNESFLQCVEEAYDFFCE